jgi:16S rRNA G966 N2-methylase RsmD
MLKGSKMSSESRKKISRSLSGEKNPNYKEGNRTIGNYPCPRCGNEMIREKRRRNIICRDCYNKERRENAKGEKIVKKEYYERNKEKIIPNQLERYNNKRVEIQEQRKDYRQKNREKIRQHQREYVKNKKSTNQNFVIQMRLRRLVLQAFDKYTKTGKVNPSIKYGIDYEKIIEHLKPFPKDMSKYHIDHIKPLCSFNFINEDGSTNLEEIKKAFAPENHQWLSAEENLSKNKSLTWEKEKDTTYSSIWLYRRKGTMYYGTKDPIANIKNYTQARGKYFSKFNDAVAENIINFWSNKNDIILDPFAGRTRCFVSALKERKYIGFEISKEVCNKIQPLIDSNKLEYKHKPLMINDDSLNVKSHLKKEVDFIFSCPPYWNLEKYESCPGQLSDIKDYNKFLDRYKKIMENSLSLLKKDKYCVLVVGDFRINKQYYTFHCDTIRIMEELGMKLHDLVVIQSVTFDIANRRFGLFKNWKFTSKIHEYLLVFKKV